MPNPPFLDEDLIYYPSSDNTPLAESTLQLNWIVSLYSNLRWWFRDQQAFVAADLFWYPVEGEPTIVKAPDVMVAFGRPDGDRLSYKQWLEEDVAPQVVIEVLSQSNSALEMLDKQYWYARYGVKELLLIDPYKNEFRPLLLEEGSFKQIDFPMVSWQSPNLGVWFKVIDSKLAVFFPDETPFKTLTETQLELEKVRLEADEVRQQMEAQKLRAEQEAARAEQEANRAQQEAIRAEQEAAKAKQEAARAEQEAARAEQEAERAEQERLRAEAAESELKRLQQQLRDRSE